MSSVAGAASSLMVMIGAVLQVAIVERIEIAGASPDVSILVVVSCALLGGSIWGMWFGFLAGLVMELAMGLPLGTHAMVAAIVGYWVGRWGDVLVTDDHPIPPLVSGVLGAAAVQVGYPLVTFLVDPTVPGIAYIWPIPVFVATLTAPCAIPVYLACRRVVEFATIREEPVDA
jgi:rod shape-determining protein MreD